MRAEWVEDEASSNSLGRGPPLLDLDEDALAGALLGGLDGRFFLTRRHDGEAFGAAWITEDLVAFLDIGEAVVEEGEDVGGDLFAEPVAGAEILVDPDLHDSPSS